MRRYSTGMKPSSIPVGIVLFILAAFPCPLQAKEDSVSEKTGTGIEIKTEPTRATVYVDGAKRGKTPLTIADLPIGQHFIRLEKSGYWTRNTIVTIPPNRRILLYLELAEAKGSLEIKTIPEGGDQTAAWKSGPEINIDGGRASPGILELKEGIHTIVVRAFGFQEERRTVNIRRGETTSIGIPLKSAAFALERVKIGRTTFNPNNPGALGETGITVGLAAPGSARVTVKSESGAVVFTAELPDFETWEQSVSWTGRDENGKTLQDGTYELIVEAEGKNAENPAKRVEPITIDSSALIFPASSTLDSSGFFFCPTTALLPRGSFELSAVILAGFPYGAEDPFGAPPFALSIRAAPIDRWETVVNLRLESDNEEAGTAVGVSVKRALLGETAAPFSAAAVARWAGAASKDASAFSALPGFEFSLPLEISTGAGIRPKAEFALAPSVLWNGETAIALGAGIGLRFQTAMAAISARAETDGGEPDLRLGVIRITAEARWFPEPSVLSYTLIAGAWTFDGEWGAFGGASLGVIY